MSQKQFAKAYFFGYYYFFGKSNSDLCCCKFRPTTEIPSIRTARITVRCFLFYREMIL